MSKVWFSLHRFPGLNCALGHGPAFRVVWSCTDPALPPWALLSAAHVFLLSWFRSKDIDLLSPGFSVGTDQAALALSSLVPSTDCANGKKAPFTMRTKSSKAQFSCQGKTKYPGMAHFCGGPGQEIPLFQMKNKGETIQINRLYSAVLPCRHPEAESWFLSCWCQCRAVQPKTVHLRWDLVSVWTLLDSALVAIEKPLKGPVLFLLKPFFIERQKCGEVFWFYFFAKSSLSMSDSKLEPRDYIPTISFRMHL